MKSTIDIARLIFGSKNFFIEETDRIVRYYNNDFDIIINKNMLRNSVVVDKREGKHVVYSNLKVAHDLLAY